VPQMLVAAQSTHQQIVSDVLQGGIQAVAEPVGNVCYRSPDPLAETVRTCRLCAAGTRPYWRPTRPVALVTTTDN